MPSGYSVKLLVEKLGIKPGYRVLVVDEPENYKELLGYVPQKVTIETKRYGEFDLVHIFVKERKILNELFPKLRKHLKEDGMVWVSWPKKISKTMNDLNENIVREIGLKNGLTDIKFCEFSLEWSGLKFVRRVVDRNK